MKIKDVTSSINLDNERFTIYLDIYELMEIFEIEDTIFRPISDNERVVNAGFEFQRYYVAPHLCTDTWVGISFLLYKKEVVAISDKPARKSSERIFWVSQEKYEELRDIVMNYLTIPTPDVDVFNFEDEIGNGFFLQFTNQILTHDGKYIPTGEKIKIYPNKKDKNFPSSSVTVTFEDGREQITDISKVLFDFV